jgi:type I restriction enzyme S subunit
VSFPRYPEYKESGLERLGLVPAHWGIYSLKRSVEGCVNGIWGDEADGENDLAVIRVADFQRSKLRVGTKKLTYRSITDKEKEARKLRFGDLLIEKSGGGDKTLVGCVVLFEHDFGAVSSNFVARMRPLSAFNSNFLCYAFDSLYKGRVNYPSIKQTTGIQNLDSESYLQERFCFPTLTEQTQIARFLDHETAKIDTLIHEQKRLIELLKEKRQAVISHAVTKGLDPDVPMKDSGVEWLGEVPAHWTKKRLKNVSPFIAVGIVVNPSSYVAEDGLPFIYGGEVKEGYIDLSKTRKISALDSKKNKKTLLETGDLVTMRVGYPGVTAIVPPSCEGGNCASVMLVKRGDFDSRWLCAVMNSRLIRQQVEVVQYGAAQKQFNIADAVEFWLLEPPQTEQAVIADFIAAKSAGFDQLMDKASQSMGLLAERRSALISAAVTGKIDVRDWQPPVDERAFNEEAKQAGMETTA